MWQRPAVAAADPVDHGPGAAAHEGGAAARTEYGAALADVRRRRRPASRRLGAATATALPPAVDVPRPGAARVPSRARLRHLFEEAFDGRLFALDPATGHVRWRYNAHRCGWSSPALGEHLVFAAFIAHSSCSSPLRNGELLAFSPATGRIRWRRAIGPCESSPLVANGMVYIGDQDGRVEAFDARTGLLRWRFDTGAPIKASPTLGGGRIYIGNYAGQLFALDARTGRLRWRDIGFGNFYSTAAVSGGRVYVGSLDGYVYAFSAGNGELVLRPRDRGYVYASLRLARSRLVGSYDRLLRSTPGTCGWAFNAGA